MHITTKRLSNSKQYNHLNYQPRDFETSQGHVCPSSTSQTPLALYRFRTVFNDQVCIKTHLPVDELAAISQTFQVHFHNWKLLYFEATFTAICS